jgi:adenylosuccinate synthase
MRRVDVVIGANFGDEGKGMMVNHLAAKSNGSATVVRFNGGAQAGHTVELPSGERHIFSHIGAGALAGCDTILSRFFIVNPVVFHHEVCELNRIRDARDIRISTVTASKDCIVTTPSDVFLNREFERQRRDRHGSCGIGIGETVERFERGYGKTLGDLLTMSTREIHDYLDFVRYDYVPMRMEEQGHHVDSDLYARLHYECDHRLYMGRLLEFLYDDFIHIVPDKDLFASSYDLIFEGAQGLMLDMDSDNFPHVTRSNTGIKNVNILLDEAGIDARPEVWYMTRAYLTRHGAGPLTNEGPLQGIHVRDLTNLPNDWQGSLRFAPLQHDTNEYIRRDAESSTCAISRNLVVTCCDQVLNAGMLNNIMEMFVDHEYADVRQSFDATGMAIRKV